MKRAELTELTAEKRGTKNSFEFWRGFSRDQEHSTITSLPNRRVPSLEVQGAHDRSPNEPKRLVGTLERDLSAAAITSHTGGASQSKWTRRSRPWNVTGSMAVVDSSSIRDDWLSPSASGPAESLDLAGNLKGGSCGQVAHRGSRILDSPVQRASGRGRSRRHLFPI